MRSKKQSVDDIAQQITRTIEERVALPLALKIADLERARWNYLTELTKIQKRHDDLASQIADVKLVSDLLCLKSKSKLTRFAAWARSFIWRYQ